jgi:diaminohydroxyphosphoribosylaminopyrimidine deaminase / 5-amino-6-(5-phosphoribosylamino)uracil reductase
MSSLSDESFLRRALALARKSIALASPNPHVGAVIVDPEGNLAGEAFHTYAGVRHAEILALEEAGERARGGTLYINLEPHCYQSRTPPCTDALIAAGIKRVVASMADPNPSVSGRGFEQLRVAGITVDVGRLQAEARQLNEAFARYIRHGVPFVTLKSAMSLDAKIGVPRTSEFNQSPGVPAGGWITGSASRAHVQEQRHENDALLVGVGTILADDPLLTDRTGKPRRRPLLRIILDSQLRVPLNSRIVQSAVKQGPESDVLIFCGLAEERKKRELEAQGIRVEQLPAHSRSRRPDIHAVLRRIGELEITSLLIEGGSTVNAIALAAGAVDKLFLYYGPKILGSQTVPFISSTYPVTGPQKPANLQIHRFGDDVAVEGYLRNPYA